MIRPLLAPRLLWLHGLAVLAVAAAVALGVWQYDSWRQGREVAATSLVHARPRPLASVMTPDGAFPGDAVGRPVTLQGRWLPRSTFFVSGREWHGRRGMWAVTPVTVCRDPGGAACAEASAMLVVRGWARSPSAAPAAPTGAVRVTGWLQPAEGTGTPDPDPHDDVVPALRVADAVQRVRQDLYAGFVVARSTAALSAGAGSGATVGHGIQAGLQPVGPGEQPKVTVLTAVRNLLYALEWWVFGGFAAYAWWRWCRDEVTRVTGVPSNA